MVTLTMVARGEIMTCTSGRGCPGNSMPPTLTRMQLNGEPYCSFCLVDAVEKGDLVLSNGGEPQSEVEVEW